MHSIIKCWATIIGCPYFSRAFIREFTNVRNMLQKGSATNDES
ncbi:hypothetical protein ACTQ6A_13210 [Lachnospiraceae bacterium LCP25S3_G4]